MTRYLAHVVSRSSGGAASAGLRGRPLRWLGSGELGLWATEWDGDATLGRDDAFAHHALVESLCAEAPCLPVRFGTWLADEAAAQRSIEAAVVQFSAALARVGERREVAITLLWPEATTIEGRGHDAASSGTAFLKKRRAVHAATDERRRLADGLATRLQTELAVDQADVRQESCPSAEVALSMSVLADPGAADELKARATAAVGTLPGVRGVVSGPWPPYSFTGDLGELGGLGGS